MKKEAIPEDDYREIEKWISSESSVVGIDAKETHILIIHKLIGIEKKLAKLNKKLKKKKDKKTK